ncbi:hypothetical protein [Brucella vulpis]|uniref:hypothetical protein n=1 Tax=Brucella vulpis TaxID=981386 RepID=UPI00073A7AD9|nr:hypothetical protein BF3285c1_0903 [Brucella vulpis]
MRKSEKLLTKQYDLSEAVHYPVRAFPPTHLDCELLLGPLEAGALYSFDPLLDLLKI